ncbi:MAG: hypothetical protein LBE79_05675, partial [Tannerella sp.]|nr:hypothetical protein [Tannerella sp.]
MRTIYFLFVTVALLLVSSVAQAQINRRIQQAAERAAERAVIRQAERRTEDAVNSAIDDAFENNDNNNSGNNNNTNNSNTNNSGNSQTGNRNQPVNESAGNNVSTPGTQQEPVKLESFTQYDFVPGDQILFFEDFSQDAVGDFPDQWTTNGSGEVRTVNIAPGKWLHPTVEDKSFNYMKTIAFPQNFIVEFDYIPTVNGSGYELTLYNEQGNKELDDGLFPGDQGFRLYLGQHNWNARG